MIMKNLNYKIEMGNILELGFVKHAIEERIENLKNDLEFLNKKEDGPFYDMTVEEIKALENVIGNIRGNATTVEESVSEDIFKDGEEVDEELEMWHLGELNKDYQFGTQSWDL